MNTLKDDDLYLLKDSFYSFRSFETENVALVSSVYPVGVIKNFLKEDFFKELQESLKFFLSQTSLFSSKNTDLFSFRQTADIYSMMGKSLNSDNTFINLHFSILEKASSIFGGEEFISIIERITSTSLSRTKIDLSSQSYEKGDYLLAHDDRLDSRRIAFVVYFVDSDWSRHGNDGGSLEFVTTDHDGLSSSSSSSSIKRQQYIPQRNEIAFFKVSKSSFHHVKEIISEKYRISLAGWLHDAECETIDVKESCSIFDNLPCSLEFLFDSFKKIIPFTEIICKGQMEQFHYFHAEPSHPLYLEWLPLFWYSSFKASFLSQPGIPILKIYIKGDWLLEDETKTNNNTYRIVLLYRKKSFYSWKGFLQLGKIYKGEDEFCTLTFPHDKEE